MPAVVHVGAALSCLALGAVVIACRKGTTRHRILGGSYAVVLLLVNIAALSIPRSGRGLGPFQILAIVSLATLVAGLVPMWVMRRTEGVVAVHAITMCFSYVGLVAAGLSQIAAERFPDQAAVAVTSVSVLTFAIGSWAIFVRVPRAITQLGGPQP